AKVKDRLYAPAEAIALAKDVNPSSKDTTVEIAMRLSVDPRKADQMVRGTANLPHGTGKTARVVVFAIGDNAAAAEEAGADYVGSDDLVERIQGGWTDVDSAVASPDMMGQAGRLGKILGSRNLMPNTRTSSVTPNVAQEVKDIKGGKIDYRVDRHASLHFIIGNTSFTAEKLTWHCASALDEVLRLKPSAAKC